MVETATVMNEADAWALRLVLVGEACFYGREVGSGKLGRLEVRRNAPPKSESRDRGVLKRATTNANQSAAALFTWTKVPKAA